MLYSRELYLAQQEGARRSAQVIVPLVLPLLGPRSVVDLGCGLGTWLAVFREAGLADLLGVDGAHVERTLLTIEPQQFVAHDLCQPVPLDRNFDLALCLEVAEHLPASCAPVLLDSLVRLAPAVLFSAAIPYQGGHGHVNEQWPAYWARLFRQRDYWPVDCLRSQIWGDARVDWWYAQNLLLYVRTDYLHRHQALKQAWVQNSPEPLALVHPARYQQLASQVLELLREGPPSSTR